MHKLVNGEIEWFQFENLIQYSPMITHGIFSRKGGVSSPPYATLNAGPNVGDNPSSLEENYSRIKSTLPNHPILIKTMPYHTTEVFVVTENDLRDPKEASVFLGTHSDALITSYSNLGLMWAVADCLTMMLVDPQHHVIGLIHAGWRGTSGCIVPNALKAMREQFGTLPSDLHIGLGPAIGPCCYEVDEPVREAFASNALAIETSHFSTVEVTDSQGNKRSSLRLDLTASNRDQFLASGVPEDHIEESNMCTGCNLDLFYSHRIEGGPTGRFAVVLALHS